MIDPCLEARTLLSGVTVLNGVLTIAGDTNNPGQDNEFTIGLDAVQADTLDIVINGVATTQSLTDISQIAVVGLGGSDQLMVDDLNGLILVPMRFDGGAGGGAIQIVQIGGSVTQASETVGLGAEPGAGTDTIVGPGGVAAVQQVLAFDRVAQLLTSVPATNLMIAPTATANGPAGSILNGNNAISYAQGPTSTSGQVTVDNAAAILFTNKTSLAINSGLGTDTISVDSAAAPFGLGQITVNGGDAGAGDTLIYNVPAGSTNAIAVLPSGQGSGEITVAPEPSPHNVHFNNISNLRIAAASTANDVLDIEGTPGDDSYVFTPGSSADSGTVTGTLDANNIAGRGPFALPTLSFSGIVPATDNTFSGFNFGEFNGGGGGTDTLVVNGSAQGAVLAVSKPPSSPTSTGIRVTDTVAGQLASVINGFGLSQVVIGVRDASNAVDVAGGVGVPIAVLGSGTGTGSTLSFGGDGSAKVVVDVGAGTVQEDGFSPVALTGITNLNVDAAGAAVSVLGTTGPDDLTYLPTGAQSAILTLASSDWTAAFSNVNVADGLAIDTKGGGDTIRVAGTAGNDTISATSVQGAPTVKVDTRLPLTFNAADIQSLVIDDGSGTGNLTVDSSAGAFPVPIIDLGHQSVLTLTGGSATFDVIAPAAGTATLVNGGGTQTVRFSGVSMVLDNVAGPLTVSGTASNDTINYGAGINASSGLVTVGNSAAVSFSNKQTLSLLGGAGDDTIALNNPSTPVGLTVINVDGGPGRDLLVVNALGNPVNVADPGAIAVATAPAISYANVEQVQIQGAPDQALAPVAANVQGILGTPLSNVLVGSFSSGMAGGQASNFTAVIDWGDGTPATAGTVVADAASRFEVFGSHAYNQALSGTITVTVIDNGGSGSVIVNGVPVTIIDQGGSTASITTPVAIAPAPLEALAQPVFGVEGVAIPAGTLVATFVDAAGLGAAGTETAQVDFGSGPVAAIVSLIPGGTTNFEVSTAAAMTFADEGTFPIRVTINGNHGTPSSATLVISAATIADAPLSAINTPALTPTEGSPLIAATVASFTDSAPTAPLSDFIATIDWGDGTPQSLGTVVQPGVAGTPFIVLGNHTYAEPGMEPVTITIKDNGGSSLNVTNTARVTAVPIILTGQLNPSSDSGGSSSDAITAVNQPTFFGTSAPSSIIRLFAAAAGGGNAFQIGQTAADSGGSWRITSSTLGDGSYLVFATAIDPSGNNPTETTILPTSHPLVIDTAGPRVTQVALDRAHGQIEVSLQDDRSGLDLTSVNALANYVLTKLRPRTAGQLRVTSIAATALNGSLHVVLTINGGHPLPRGTDTLTILASSGAGGIRDLAGNALQGAFSGSFPSGNGMAGTNFVAELDTTHQRVLAAKVKAAAAVRSLAAHDAAIAQLRVHHRHGR